MAEFKTIPLGDIIVPERLRTVEEDHALAIQASIVEHGLINPITVRRTPPATKPFRLYTLVAGAHRLRAIELLEEDGIEAMIVEADRAEAQLVEITENLFRNELSVIDRAVFVGSYREIWEQKHGKIEAGRPSNRCNLLQLLEDEASSGFAGHVADRLGVSKDTVKRAQFLHRALAPDLRRSLRGTPAADNQSQLLKLAKMEPARQRLIATAIAQGHDLPAAIEHTDPHAKAKATKTLQQELLDRLMSTWSRADKKTKAAFLDHIGAGA